MRPAASATNRSASSTISSTINSTINSTILATATAVPEHTASQTAVQQALRRVFPIDGRRMDAVMAIFENAQIDNRYSVYPVEQIGRRRSLTESTREYRGHAIAMARDVAARALAGARVAARDVD